MNYQKIVILGEVTQAAVHHFCPYTKVFYSITVSAGTAQTLNAYMPPDTYTEFVTFRFLDESTGQPTPVEGVSLSVSRVVGSSWQQIFVLSSDVTGKAGFYYEPFEQYRFIATKTGFEIKSFSLSPILESSYDVYLTRSDTLIVEDDYSEVIVYYTPKLFYNGEDNNITFTFISPTGSFTSYRYNVTWKTNTYLGSGSNANGQTYNILVPVTGASFGDELYVTQCYDTASIDEKCFYDIYPIAYGGTYNTTFAAIKQNDYNMSQFDQTAMAVGWTVLWTGAGAIAGGPLGAGAMAIISYGSFLATGLISIWHIIISLVVLFFVVTGWSR